MSKFPGRLITDLADTGYSVYFDGAGDYLTIADNTALDMEASNFTIETWIYLTSTPAASVAICGKRATTGTFGGVNLYFPSNALPSLLATVNGTTWGVNFSSTRAIQINAWNHVAATRSGDTWTVWVNGQSGGTATVSGTVPNNASAFTVAATSADGGQPLSAGYLSNFRVVKGTALYTAAFTPPTQLFSIPNTSLLTCNSPAIIDQSNNAFAITVNGDSKVSTLTPFTAYVPYNPALGASTPGVWTLDEALQAKGTRQWNMYDPRFNLTTLLLHGNGTNTAQNNTFLDSSSNNFPITRNPASGPNAPTQGSFSPFSLQPGQWSNYFNGSSYLTAAANSGFSLAGDFTIEMWINPPSLSTTNSIIIIESAASSGLYLAINAGTSTVNIFLNSSTVSFTATPVGGIALNTWTHVALVRSGSTVTLYVNGVAASGTGSSAATLGSSTTPFRIGGFTGAYTGYISNLRVVNGRAVYTSNFTPSPSPLTATSGGQNPPTGTQTTLLTCQANRFVDAGGLVTPITISVAGGTPSVQSFSPFYSTAAYTPATVGGSGYFDGTGDYLTVADNAALQWGTGDFCFETWVYLTAIPSTFADLICKGTNNAGTFEVTITSAGKVGLYTTTAVFNSVAVLTRNQWYHIAITRSGTTLRCFINGALDTTVSSFSTDFNNTGTVYIGTFGNGTGNNLTGYLSSHRCVKGSPVYTAAFTPPTAPLTNITNTSLLLNFTNAGIVDSTAKNVLETVGNAQISTTQSVFGGTSMSFNGTNSTLLLRNSQLMNLGSSDFTLEFWMYRSAATASQPFYSLSGSSQTNSLALDMNASGGLLAYATASGGAVWSILNGSSFGTVPLTTWTHVALVRNGSTWRGYLNGVAGFTVTNSSALASFDGASIGSSGVSTLWFNGFIDDFRITRFARYTANFTPQTSQWQDE